MAERRESICNKCAHTDCVWKPIGAYEPPIFACITFKRKETTQGDRIRAMSDSVLAERLAWIFDCDHNKCPAKEYCRHQPCDEAWMQYLQSPVGGAE